MLDGEISIKLKQTPINKRIFIEDGDSPVNHNIKETLMRGFLDKINQIMMLMSFKLADMVNIALEENTYFRSRSWCE